MTRREGLGSELRGVAREQVGHLDRGADEALLGQVFAQFLDYGQLARQAVRLRIGAEQRPERIAGDQAELHPWIEQLTQRLRRQVLRFEERGEDVEREPRVALGEFPA